jgi:hypothetical protein
MMHQGAMAMLLCAVAALAVDGLVLYTRAPGGSRYTGAGELRLAQLTDDTLRGEYSIDDGVLSAQLSPDCSRVAYVRLRNGFEQILVADLSGANRRMLKSGMEHPSDIRWCAYLCWRLPGAILYSYRKSTEVYAIHPQTGEESIYHTASVGFSKVSCDLSGKRLTVRARTEYNGVVNIDLDSGGVEQRIGGGCSNWVSPDGSMITHCTGGWSTYAIRLWDGTVYKQYTSPEQDKHLAHWSHNSNDWIILQCGANRLMDWGHLWIQNVHTGDALRLTEHREYNDTGRDMWVGDKALPPGAGTVLSFTAAPSNVAAGAPVTLTWRTANAQTVVIDPASTASSLPTRGSITVTPSVTTTYTITAEGVGGATRESLTIRVGEDATPVIVSPARSDLVKGATYELRGSGTDLAWYYDADSDGKGRLPIDTGASVRFTVPTEVSGANRLTVFLRGGGGEVSTTYDLVERAPVALALLTPRGGEQYLVGEKVVIEWEADTSVLTEVEIDLSIDQGQSWLSLTGTATVSAFDDTWPCYEWIIPDHLPGEGGEEISLAYAPTCLIRVSPYDNQTIAPAVSEAFFSIGREPIGVHTTRPPSRASAGGGMACVYLVNGARVRFYSRSMADVPLVRFPARRGVSLRLRPAGP